MSQDFHAARERLMDRHSERPPERVREEKRAFPVIQIVVGFIWGLVFMNLAVFSNKNFEKVQAAMASDDNVGTLYRIVIAFILCSLVLLSVAILRRLLSSSFRRRRGWSLILAFFVGTASVSLAVRMGAAGPI